MGKTILARLGQLIVGLFFVAVGVLNIIHWQPNLDILTNVSFPLPTIALGIAIAYEIFFGLLLVLNVTSRLAACALILFSIVTAPIYLPFWNLSGDEFTAVLTQFLSVIAIIGGLIVIASQRDT